MTEEDEKLLTLKEAMGYLRVSRSTILRFVAKGELQEHKVGRLLRFYLGDIKKLVKHIEVVNEVDEWVTQGEREGN